MNLNCKIFYDDYLYKLNTYSHKNIILRKPQVKKFSWLPFLGFFIEFLYDYKKNYKKKQNKY